MHGSVPEQILQGMHCCTFSCSPPYASLAVLAGMVFLIFSILGVQLFAGLLWSCNDDTVAGKVRGRDMQFAALHLPLVLDAALDAAAPGRTRS